MTNGVASPRMMVYLSIRPVSTAITIPSIYSEKTASAPFCPKKAAANTAKIARRAPQDINGAIMMVIRRSRGASSVRAPITDGTLQPKPTISGTKDFPGKPSACIRRSITNAARAIYPESSRKERNRYIMPICGTSGSTVLIPPPRPWARKIVSQSGKWSV